MADMSREEAAQYLAWMQKLYPGAEITIEQEEIDAIKVAIAALRQPGWVRTADRLPEGDEHDEILGLYKGTGYLLYDIVQIGWLWLHPEMYVYWTHLPKKPEVEG